MAAWRHVGLYSPGSMQRVCAASLACLENGRTPAGYTCVGERARNWERNLFLRWGARYSHVGAGRQARALLQLRLLSRAAEAAIAAGSHPDVQAVAAEAARCADVDALARCNAFLREGRV